MCSISIQNPGPIQFARYERHASISEDYNFLSCHMFVFAQCVHQAAVVRNVYTYRPSHAGKVITTSGAIA